MFPILKTKQEIEDLKAKGFKEGIDFKIGISYGKCKGFEKDSIEEERWEISYPGVLT